MVPTPVQDAEQTTQPASMGSRKRLTRKPTLGGELLPIIVEGFVAANRRRYAEMLEGQHALTVQGLEKLYHRIVEKKGWPGGELKPGPEGHPLVHDVLSRLGVLEQGKVEHCEHDHGNMQPRRWCTNCAQPQENEEAADRF
jgi:hypothetical protein